MERWLKYCDIDKTEYIVFVIMHQVHFSLLILVKPFRKDNADDGGYFVCLDSLGENGYHVSSVICDKITNFLIRKYNKEDSVVINVNRNDIIRCEVPLQFNGTDCGLFTLMNLELVLQMLVENDIVKTEIGRKFRNKFNSKDVNKYRTKYKLWLYENFKISSNRPTIASTTISDTVTGNNTLDLSKNVSSPTLNDVTIHTDSSICKARSCENRACLLCTSCDKRYCTECFTKPCNQDSEHYLTSETLEKIKLSNDVEISSEISNDERYDEYYNEFSEAEIEAIHTNKSICKVTDCNNKATDLCKSCNHYYCVGCIVNVCHGANTLLFNHYVPKNIFEDENQNASCSQQSMIIYGKSANNSLCEEESGNLK
jgi:hypothetical protein